jgi:hypothetical protein
MFIFEESQVFIFPSMIRSKFIYLFYNVIKMVITHKKIATFGYKQLMYLETC